MREIVAFTGLAGVGKDTAAKVLLDRGWQALSFADPIRESLLKLNPYIPIGTYAFLIPKFAKLADLVAKHGWDFCKRMYPEVRKLMQVFGSEVGRETFGEDVWVELLTSKIKTVGQYVITDMRYANELDAIQWLGGTIIYLDRPGIVQMAHASEQLSFDISAAIEIHNDKSIKDLHEEVLYVLRSAGHEI
jgi:hypothetical protein